ncbi:MAG: right-handed parallel beta-helix repeat-containing protein [Candidatus Dojkabacteria bacterium]|nr:right-handed parallel beta-helix repeat-containing protein [Candidatus Dojkabacteria bacterium]
MNTRKLGTFAIALFLVVATIALIYLLTSDGNFDIRDKAAAERTVTVCPSGCDYAMFNDAIANAQDHDLIMIDTDTYNTQGLIQQGPGVNYPLPASVKTLTIEGRSEGDTRWILDDDSLGNGNIILVEGLQNTSLTFKNISFENGDGITSNALVRFIGTDIEGETETNPNQGCTFNFENVEISGSSSFGLYISGENTATVKNSTFADNERAGLSIHGKINATIEDSNFKGNIRQGLAIRNESEFMLTKSNFEDNSIKWKVMDGNENLTDFGALQLYDYAKGIIEDNKFSQNYGVGIALGRTNNPGRGPNDGKIISFCEAEIRNNEISSSLESAGIYVLGKSKAFITYNLVSLNADYGIVGDGDAYLEIINNTIAHNGVYAIGAFGGNSRVLIKNNAIVFNKGPFGMWDEEYHLETEYNGIFGHPRDNPNLGSGFILPESNIVGYDPRFKGEEDFNLNYYGCTSITLPCLDNCPNHCSPFIDAGDPDLDNDGITWETDSDDQDPDGSRRDIGAFPVDKNVSPDPPTDKTCDTDNDCKGECYGSRNLPYQCKDLKCEYGSKTICTNECNAECVIDDDCIPSQVCEPDGCYCRAYYPPSMCDENSDCKTPCGTSKRLSYECNMEGLGNCIIGEKVCDKECGAECIKDSDCSTGNCDTSTCSCASDTPPPPAGKCDRSDIWGPSGKADGKIDSYDLSLLLANWKWQKEPRNIKADIWGPSQKADGKVDSYDLSKLLGCWSKK